MLTECVIDRCRKAGLRDQLFWRSSGCNDDGELVVAGNDEHFDLREQLLCYVFIIYIKCARLIKFSVVNCSVIFLFFCFLGILCVRWGESICDEKSTMTRLAFSAVFKVFPCVHSKSFTLVAFLLVSLLKIYQ